MQRKLWLRDGVLKQNNEQATIMRREHNHRLNFIEDLPFLLVTFQKSCCRYKYYFYNYVTRTILLNDGEKGGGVIVLRILIILMIR